MTFATFSYFSEPCDAREENIGVAEERPPTEQVGLRGETTHPSEVRLEVSHSILKQLFAVFPNLEPFYLIMSRASWILCICLLQLLACKTGSRGFATDIKHRELYYGNATDIIPSEILESPFPYNFPDARAPENPFPMPDCDGFVLEEATVDLLQDAMNKGQLTCTKIVLCYLQRIYQTNEYAK